jgi:hypothetical protein
MCTEETPHEAIFRLQTKIDAIEDEIGNQRKHLATVRRNPIKSEHAKREIEKLLDQRDAIIRNILQIKKNQHSLKQKS